LQQGIFILNLVLDHKNWNPEWAKEQAAMMNIMDKFEGYEAHYLPVIGLDGISIP
jgi:hypothetical protein